MALKTMGNETIVKLLFFNATKEKCRFSDTRILDGIIDLLVSVLFSMLVINMRVYLSKSGL